MEDQTPIPTESVTVNTVEPVKPKPSFAVPLLSILTLVLVASTGFLAYQNMQLQKQVAALTTTVIPSAVSDPTANWKTYTNNKIQLSFKYPNDKNLQIFSSPQNEFSISLNTARHDPLYLDVALLKNTQLESWYNLAYKDSVSTAEVPPAPALSKGPILDNFASYYSDFDLAGFGKIRHLFVQKDSDLYQVHLPLTNNTDQYQILSTFRFVQPASAKDQVLAALTGYLNALTTGDCVTVKSYLTQAAKAEFQDVECSTSYNKWERVDEFDSVEEEASFYSQSKIIFSVKLFKPNDSVGTLVHMMFEKEGGSWKTDVFYMKEF